MELNDYQKTIQEDIDDGSTVIRLWGDRDSGKTAFLVDRVVKLASFGDAILVVLPNTVDRASFRISVLEELGYLGIRSCVDLEDRDLIYLRGGGSIFFVSPGNVKNQIEGRKFREILVDNDHLFSKMDWEILRTEVFPVVEAERLISLGY